ncbi:MAG: ribonuclease III [Nannocystis sp.]|uniref:ribonuclease III family protein n=1 Tax=Nannocystis sp. TaxID=1962667 RepID=UPI0024284993|nr:ribonuclease III domain-containing protein [Nannocystis sp.]MBK9755118.1 ribonuclease III [Nannocystis sp.]
MKFVSAIVGANEREPLAEGTGGRLAEGTGGERLSEGTGGERLSEGTGAGQLADGTGGGTEGLPAVLAVLPPADPQLAGLAGRLGHRFARPALLRAALTTPSWVNEHQGAGWPSNACLEFLGDAVLGLVAADALWRRFPELGEGDLTRLRASLVSASSLAAAARAFGLAEFMYLGRNEVKTGVLEREGALPDALEATLAAAFLDARAAGGDPLAAASAVFTALLGERVAGLSRGDGVDAKSQLQVLLQAKHRRAPAYRTIGERPPGQGGLWQVEATLTLPEGQVIILAEGSGVSLRAAEQAAAKAALTALERGALSG